MGTFFLICLPNVIHKQACLIIIPADLKKKKTQNMVINTKSDLILFDLEIWTPPPHTHTLIYIAKNPYSDQLINLWLTALIGTLM